MKIQSNWEINYKLIKGLIMAPNECYLVVLNMQVYIYIAKYGVLASISRSLPLGSWISYSLCNYEGEIIVFAYWWTYILAVSWWSNSSPRLWQVGIDWKIQCPQRTLRYSLGSLWAQQFRIIVNGRKTERANQNQYELRFNWCSKAG